MDVKFILQVSLAYTVLSKLVSSVIEPFSNGVENFVGNRLLKSKLRSQFHGPIKYVVNFCVYLMLVFSIAWISTSLFVPDELVKGSSSLKLHDTGIEINAGGQKISVGMEIKPTAVTYTDLKLSFLENHPDGFYVYKLAGVLSLNNNEKKDLKLKRIQLILQNNASNERREINKETSLVIKKGMIATTKFDKPLQFTGDLESASLFVEYQFKNFNSIKMGPIELVTQRYAVDTKLTLHQVAL